MRPTDRLTRPIAGLVIAILVAACSTSGGPAAPPRARRQRSAVRRDTRPRSRPAPAASALSQAPAGAGDAWLVVGRPGEDGLRVMLASSGEEDFELPLGVPDDTWGHLVTVTSKRPNSVIEDLTVQPGFGGPIRTIEGAWRLPTVGLDPMPVGVSADGSTIVLVEDRPEGAAAPTVSRFAILERSLRSEPRIVELPGVFDFDTLSPDGSILYVAEHVPGPLAGRYQVRAVDTATGVMRPEIIVDKRNIDEAMAGWPVDQELRTDGVVLTLYRGVEHPFIHALHSPEAWAVCIDLPTRGMDDTAATADWGVVATPDRRLTLAVNATLGMIVQVHTQDLNVQRVVDFEPSAQRGITLAKFGHAPAGAVGRRVVVATDGQAVFAAGARGHRPDRDGRADRHEPAARGHRGRRHRPHAGRRHALRPRSRRAAGSPASTRPPARSWAGPPARATTGSSGSCRGERRLTGAGRPRGLTGFSADSHRALSRYPPTRTPSDPSEALPHDPQPIHPRARRHPGDRCRRLPRLRQRPARRRRGAPRPAERGTERGGHIAQRSRPERRRRQHRARQRHRPMAPSPARGPSRPAARPDTASASSSPTSRPSRTPSGGRATSPAASRSSRPATAPS